MSITAKNHETKSSDAVLFVTKIKVQHVSSNLKKSTLNHTLFNIVCVCFCRLGNGKYSLRRTSRRKLSILEFVRFFFKFNCYKMALP